MNSSSSPPASMPADDIGRAAAMLQSCDGAGDAHDTALSALLAQRLSAWTVATDGAPGCAPAPNLAFDPNEVRCVLAAGHDCDAVFACFNGGAPAPACAAEEWHCEGDLVVGCRNYGDAQHPALRPARFDCAPSGRRCVTAVRHDDQGDHPYAACGVGRCDPSTRVGCDGSVQVMCPDGIETRADCALFTGGPCEVHTDEHGGTLPACELSEPGAACDKDSTSKSCDGDVALSCGDGHVRRFDCSLLGPDVGCGGGDCVQDGEATRCDDRFHEQCDGPRWLFCHLGRVTSVDCPTLGFTTCGAAASGKVACVR